MTKVFECADHADASLKLAAAIAARFGPDALDDLMVEAFKCPHEGTDKAGVVLAAWPRATGARAGDLVMVYYGDTPERLE